MAADKPRFIRRNGRIIPIGVKKDKVPRGTQTKGMTPTQKTDLKKGIAFVGGGIASAFLLGAVGGKLMRAGFKTGEEIVRKTALAAFSRGQVGHASALGDRAATFFLRSAARKRKVFAAQMKAGKFVAEFGKDVLGGILIGEGLSHFAKAANKGKHPSDFQDVGAQVAGFGLLIGAKKGFESGFGRRLLRRLTPK